MTTKAAELLRSAAVLRRAALAVWPNAVRPYKPPCLLLSANCLLPVPPHPVGNLPGIRLLMANRAVRTIITMHVVHAVILKKRLFL